MRGLLERLSFRPWTRGRLAPTVPRCRYFLTLLFVLRILEACTEPMETASSVLQPAGMVPTRGRMLQLARKSGKTANLSGVTPTAAVTGIIGPGNTIILT